MTYFQDIRSLADLKKEYRRLAMLHHPDKGGDTVLMQKLNGKHGQTDPVRTVQIDPFKTA